VGPRPLRLSLGEVIMRPGALVEVAHLSPHSGQRVFRPAKVLTAMPRLVIVEYGDGRRHCIPKERVRPITVPVEMLRAR
jgi:hypothetical protein